MILFIINFNLETHIDAFLQNLDFSRCAYQKKSNPLKNCLAFSKYHISITFIVVKFPENKGFSLT